MTLGRTIRQLSLSHVARDGTPDRVTFSTRMNGIVTDVMENAPPEAARNSGRLGDLPSFDLSINARIFD